MLFFSNSQELINLNEIKTKKIDEKTLRNQQILNITNLVNDFYHDEQTAHQNIQKIAVLISKDLDDINTKKKLHFANLFLVFKKLWQCSSEHIRPHGIQKIMSNTIINLPHDVIDLIIFHIMNNIDEDILDYYYYIINLKISCKTFLYQLKYFKYYDLIKTYFNISNDIQNNYIKFVQHYKYNHCANPNCYDDTDDWCNERLRSPRYIHHHQFACYKSHYCTYCKMNFTLLKLI